MDGYFLFRWNAARFVGALLLGALSACEWHFADAETQTATPPFVTSEQRGSNDGGAAPNVDPFRELLVIDREVVDSTEASNSADGALSFRRRAEEWSRGAEGRESTLIEQWLRSFAETSADAAARPNVDRAVLGPWKALAAGEYSMQLAPFRLIAVVNRLDLADDENGCVGSAGELRLVYTLEDARTHEPLAATVIVEVDLGNWRTAAEWARAWHALRDAESGYVARLSQLVTEATRHANLEDITVRTNESAFGDDGTWELREFRLALAASSPALVLSPLTQSPVFASRFEPRLREWADKNEADILRGIHVLPPSLRATVAPLPYSSFRFWIPGAGSEVSDAFSRASCAGCHGGDRPDDPLTFQHLAPPSRGYYGRERTFDPERPTQVSTYLYDPRSPSSGELARRAKIYGRFLATTCQAQAGNPRPTYRSQQGACSSARGG